MISAFPARRGDGVSAWRLVAERLEAEIAAGDFARGGKLPSEVLVAERMGVNRHTVRRAIAYLAERGIVRAARGSGTYVEPSPLRYPIGPRTRFSEIASRAGREAWGLLASAATVPAEHETAEALGVAPGTSVLRLATIHEADGVPISTAVTWLPLPRFEGFDGAYAGSGSITRAFAAYGVADYLRLSTRITARAANAEETALLNLTPGKAVLVVDSVNVDTAGARIQATHARFAADRVELTIES